MHGKRSIITRRKFIGLAGTTLALAGFPVSVSAPAIAKGARKARIACGCARRKSVMMKCFLTSALINSMNNLRLLSVCNYRSRLARGNAQTTEPHAEILKTSARA